MMGSFKIMRILFCFSLFSELFGAFFHGYGFGGKNNGWTSVPDDHQPVQLHIEEKYVVMDNGMLQLNLSKPEGSITGIKYNGIDNLLETLNDETDRGYWDVVWSDESSRRKKGNFDRIQGTKFSVIVKTDEQIEVSFSSGWDPSLRGTAAPLNFDIRYIMLRGSSGFYVYGIYEHMKEWPAFDLDNTRVVFKLSKQRFRYMAIADDRQRKMPLPEDRSPPRGQPLAYPEAVLLVDPIEPQFKGEVDDKYQYSCEHRNIQVHGWIAPQGQAPVGFWQITPSNEFRSGGPLKQSLTSHVGPTSLTILHSTHYTGADLIAHFGPNEPWKKVYGPFFIYLNSLSNGGDPNSLWEDANQQTMKEVESWPYNFPASEDFPKADQRGTIAGRVLVQDRFVSSNNVPADGAYLVLALPGESGSWQLESKGYQYWTRTDKDGKFTINNIRAGEYNLYGWVPGFIGEYRNDAVIKMNPGSKIDVDDLVYTPPRHGPTLWEIGVPDRTAAEFYIPDADPKYINKLYIDHDKFRQYGLWERYTELYPEKDLVFTIGSNNYSTDWFYAQVTRKKDNGTYTGTTWQIKFNLGAVDQERAYTLTLALATAHVAELQVRVNNLNSNPPLFTTEQIGRDNTIARHGIHGVYRMYGVKVPGSQLLKGENTIFLSQTLSSSPFQGIMYDYIRLEASAAAASLCIFLDTKSAAMASFLFLAFIIFA